MKNLKKKDLLKLIAYMGMRIDVAHASDVRKRMNEVIGDTEREAHEPEEPKPKRMFLMEVVPRNTSLHDATNPLRDKDQNSLQAYIPKKGCTVWDVMGRVVTWFCVYDNGTIEYVAIDAMKNSGQCRGTHEELKHWKVATK